RIGTASACKQVSRKRWRSNTKLKDYLVYPSMMLGSKVYQAFRISVPPSAAENFAQRKRLRMGGKPMYGSSAEYCWPSKLARSKTDRFQANSISSIKTLSRRNH